MTFYSSIATVSPSSRPALFYFLAAGAVGVGVGVGGFAAAIFLFRRGQQEAAAHTLVRDAELVAQLLRTQIDLAPLREQVRAVGGDPDLVEQGYRDMRDGRVTFDQVVARLCALGQG